MPLKWLNKWYPKVIDTFPHRKHEGDAVYASKGVILEEISDVPFKGEVAVDVGFPFPKKTDVFDDWKIKIKRMFKVL